jgi:hypothetical protein
VSDSIKLDEMNLDENFWCPLPEEMTDWKQFFDRAKSTPEAPQRILIDHDLYEMTHVATVAFPEDEQKED